MSFLKKISLNISKRDQAPVDMDEDALIGPNLHFAASEAYKLLRTNLMFSLPDEKNCRIIGVTSSIRGEGKSTTALNLAYSLAEADNKVLLMELDMRLPTVAKRLSIAEKPGLSNFLVGMCKSEQILRRSGLHPKLHVITAGEIPPNPSELLSSKEMGLTLEAMREYFDFIILDLPPVNDVSDALIVSKLTHGLVMVVRQNYNNELELKEAMRQLKIVDAKLLGFVMTAGESRANKYYNRKYKKYGYSREYRGME